MKAKDVMTTNVVCVSPQATVLQAVRIMLQRKISGLPVVADDGEIVGMVTEGDLLRRAETGTQKHRPRWIEFFVGPGRIATDYVHAHGRKINEIMTTDPVTVTEDTPLDEVVSMMEKRRIKRVPVVLAGKVVGIISRANLLHALAAAARDIKTGNATDAEIRAHLLAELSKEAWAPVAALDIVVHQGVVELRGTITDDLLRPAIIVAAENVPGVREVHDHLAWIDPLSYMVVLSPEDEELAKAS
jgi:CBS domain-containing protein